MKSQLRLRSMIVRRIVKAISHSGMTEKLRCLGKADSKNKRSVAAGEAVADL